MSLVITDLPLSGLKLIAPKVYPDERGYFVEVHHQKKLKSEGFSESFVQDNLSRSRRGVLRGLHYQDPHSQGKLVSAISGEIFDVAVDMRRDSPSFGKWYGVRLSEQNGQQLYIPGGFAHGFCVLSESAHVLYKCTDYYHPEAERTLLWNDPDVGIDWPIRDPLVSPKDAAGKLLRDLGPVG